MQLNLNNITYTYESAALPALSQVNLTFPVGWTGIIGDNGCGKTTLALIASGAVMPDSGHVLPQLVSAYCPQDTSIAPPTLEAFATDWSSDALYLRDALAIDESWLWNYDQLSGGQKKRVQIACALGQHPDVLILDEPTNDLDASTREQILHVLEQFSGIGILISHDRQLLDDLADRCVVFEGGNVTVRPGGYAKAMTQLKDERSSQVNAHEKARREERRLRSETQRRKEEASRSSARLSAKGLAKHDSDAREKLGRARVSSKDSIAGRSAATMTTRHERAQRSASESRTQKRYDGTIQLPGAALRSKFALRIDACDLRRGDLELHIPELGVSPRDHIGITGKNGAGKTTLIRHLRELALEREACSQLTCAFIPQEVDEGLRRAALVRLCSLDDGDKGRVLSLVAGLNTDPDTLRAGADISPGEMKKLLIAEQLLAEPNLLILDEPTNHLDVGSIKALQTALAEFPGAIVMVSHDAMLLDAVCPSRWSIERMGDESVLHVLG